MKNTQKATKQGIAKEFSSRFLQVRKCTRRLGVRLLLRGSLNLPSGFDHRPNQRPIRKTTTSDPKPKPVPYIKFPTSFFFKL